MPIIGYWLRMGCWHHQVKEEEAAVPKHMSLGLFPPLISYSFSWVGCGYRCQSSEPCHLPCLISQIGMGRIGRGMDAT